MGKLKLYIFKLSIWFFFFLFVPKGTGFFQRIACENHSTEYYNKTIALGFFVVLP